MKRRLFRLSIAVSIFLHMAVPLLVWLESVRVERDRAQKKVVEIVIQEAPARKEEKPEEMKQLVEQNPESLNDEVPDDAKFMSQKNQKVIEETRAANNGAFTNKGLKNQEAVEQKQARQKKPRPSQAKATKSGLPTLDALKPNFDWDQLGQTAQKADTASATDDYLKDVKTGAQTLLSTREFLYYSYYNRIKSQLKQYWEPSIKHKVKRLFQQGRTIATDQDRITKVLITLNAKGILIKVQVVDASGIKDLDDAAVEAFRAAAPFPNPPKGIIEADGNIRIRWDFVLES